MKSVRNLNATTDAKAQDTAALTEEELRQLQEEVVQPRLRELVMTRYLPVDDSTPDWATSVDWDEITGVNFRSEQNAQNDDFSNPEQTEIDKIEMKAERQNQGIFRRYLGAELQKHKVDAARAHGTDIRTQKTRLLRTAHNRFRDRLGILGADSYGVEGLANVSGVQSVTQVTAADTWPQYASNGNETDIVDDFLSLAQAVVELDGFQAPVDFLIPEDRHAFLSKTFTALDQGSERSILDMVQDNVLVGEILSTSLLEDVASQSNEHVAIAAANESQFMDFLLPNAIEFLDPMEQQNENILLRTKQVVGGLRVKDSQAIARMTGI
jgi:hypothetical protein